MERTVITVVDLIGVLGVVRVVLVVNSTKAWKKSGVQCVQVNMSGGAWGQINHDTGAVRSKWEGHQGGGLHLFRGQRTVIGRYLSWRRTFRRILGNGVVHVGRKSNRNRVWTKELRKKREEQRENCHQGTKKEVRVKMWNFLPARRRNGMG